VLYFDHAFEAQLARHGVGKIRVIWYSVLFLPLDVARTLPLAKYPRLRIVGEIADMPVEGAWMPTGDGRHYFIVAPAIRKSSRARFGTTLEMRFRVDDQNRVDVPDELIATLDRSKSLKKAWSLLTAGQQRGHCHSVRSAKTPATTMKRVAQVIDALSSSPKQSQR
jgi:hypothetical protein